MDALWIEGGAQLQGTVEIAGAKNATLPMMAASLLARGPVTLRQAPFLQDVHTMSTILQLLGAVVTREGRDVRVDPRHVSSFEAPYDHVRRMRASIYVLGPLVARWGRARVSLPGGCAWGPRPVNFHLEGLRRMGASVDLDSGYIVAACSRLRGARICLDFPSVGATIQLMMAASLAAGETLIENAAREPEVSAVGDLLRRMGAAVDGCGSDAVHIQGVNELSGVEADVMPDRIEAGTYLVAGAMAGGDLELRPVEPAHLTAVIEKLSDIGCSIDSAEECLRVRSSGELRPFRLTTAPYPGFPTDMQAQMMALACTIRGASVIEEGIYLDRFSHVPELGRLGADIQLDRAVAVVNGGRPLQGATVMATDLRASVALVLAGLVARGRTLVRRIYHLDRGYERLVHKLQNVGAVIDRFVEK
jgi:UDP-N-acetylglucosamine 1-carboxyvinyltransferase